MSRTLLVGAAPSPDVMDLQDALNVLMSSPGQASRLGALAVDGVFGRKTQLRVQEFQAINGLAPDGMVTPLTWQHIRAALSRVPGLLVVRTLGGGGPPGGGKGGGKGGGEDGSGGKQAPVGYGGTGGGGPGVRSWPIGTGGGKGGGKGGGQGDGDEGKGKTGSPPPVGPGWETALTGPFRYRLFTKDGGSTGSGGKGGGGGSGGGGKSA